MLSALGESGRVGALAVVTVSDLSTMWHLGHCLPLVLAV